MSLGTANRDGGKTSESGHLRGLSKAFRGDVTNGLAVSQRGAGANMSVDIAIGDAFVPRSDGTYSHPVFNDAVLNQVIATADPSNPRRDILVMYVDYGNAVSTGVSNNTNGVVKVKVVAGTPAGSPVDPTDSAIQASVGSGNPFIKLARIRVGAGVSSIGNSVIDDLRRMATAHVQGGWLYEYLYTWVYVSATSFKIAGVDATAQFPVGTKIQLYQAGVALYFYVKSAVFSTDTTVTLDGSTAYALTNIPIDHPAYSYNARPQGFPYATISEPLNWYQELARVTAPGGSSSLATGTFAAKKYLRFIITVLPSAAFNSGRLQFNGDTGASNYPFRVQTNGAADSTGATNGIAVDVGNAAQASPTIITLDVLNIATQEKVAVGAGIDAGASGAGGTPNVRTGMGKWANAAAQITSATAAFAGGTFNAGSEIVVLGHD